MKQLKELVEKILERLDEPQFYIGCGACPIKEKCDEVQENINDEKTDLCAETMRVIAKEIVQEVAEEYNDGWIPCSERLPEESGYYLVTYHDWSDGNFLPKYDDTYVRRLHYQINEHFVGWNYPKNVDDRAENDCHKEVIAWQQLPEPYE